MNNQLQPIEHNNQRILTTQQLAEAYGTDDRIISNNFTRNRERYSEGKHYYALESTVKTEFLNRHQIDDGSHAKIFYLWTEKGAWLHAKSLNTDKAWDAYEMLVDDYYKLKKQPDSALPNSYSLESLIVGVQAEVQRKQQALAHLKQAQALLDGKTINVSVASLHRETTKTDVFDAKAYLLYYIDKLENSPKDPPTLRNLGRYGTLLDEESIKYYLQYLIEQGVVYEDRNHRSPYYRRLLNT